MVYFEHLASPTLISRFHTVYSTRILLPHWFYREINFGWFQKVKSWHFNRFWGFEFWYSELLNGQNGSFCGIQNNQNWFDVKSEWKKTSESFHTVLLLSTFGKKKIFHRFYEKMQKFRKIRTFSHCGLSMQEIARKWWITESQCGNLKFFLSSRFHLK